MQGRPSEAASPLAMALSLPLPHRSSLLSSLSGPHTPPNNSVPLPLFTSSNANRKSTDSWNSSNYDLAEDLELEWTPEQIKLLRRTLESLPAHLLTPFNGPVPPSNLLDKIARGVSDAKGPLDWPQSVRATRAKIVELARGRVKDVANESSSDTIAEEDDHDGYDSTVLKSTTNTSPNRPLYRQSSMDFMQTEIPDLKNNKSISRLSRRLQKTERMITSSPRRLPVESLGRASSPIIFANPGSRLSLHQSSGSSTTLNSDDAISRIPRLQRSISSMSSSSDAYVAPVIDPRLQRIKRSESFGGSLLYNGLKRAPSFGTPSRRSSGAMSVELSSRNSDVTSSDEEEKLRSVKAKKARVKPSSPTPTALSSPRVSSPKPAMKSSPSPTKVVRNPSNIPVRRSNRTRANLERNPSILGAELPKPQPTPEPPAPMTSPRVVRRRTHKPTKSSDSTASSRSMDIAPDVTPPTPQLLPPKRVVRIKDGRFPPAVPGRRISFGSMLSPTSQENNAPASGTGLGDAFQLR